MPTYSKQELQDSARTQIRMRSSEMPPELHVLANRLLDAIPETVEFDHHPVYLPVLLVLPFGAVPFEHQLEAVRYSPAGSDIEPQPAYSFLKADNIVDLAIEGVKLPDDEPYLLLHVDDGLSMKGDSPESACAALAGLDNPRCPVTAAQGIALAIDQPWLFDRHNMYLSGSRIKDEKTGELYAPDLWVYGGKIKMKRDSARDADPRWATPSWRGIITL